MKKINNVKIMFNTNTYLFMVMVSVTSIFEFNLLVNVLFEFHYMIYFL